VLLWSSWGALLDEDVYPLFGMRASKLNERFNRIVAALSASEQCLNDGDRDLLARARRHQQSRRAAEKAQPPHAAMTDLSRSEAHLGPLHRQALAPRVATDLSCDDSQR
jgi:hypothetical protein